MELSLGLRLEPWRWSLGVDFGVEYIRGQELVLIHQFLVNAYFYEALSFYSVCFFCHVSLTYINQDLNICFIINRQV